LCPWLNSNGIHAGEGFYRVFSAGLKGVILATNVPNKEWKSGKEYTTEDLVFVPSTTELGDTNHKYTYRIGFAYPYFTGVGAAKRVALLSIEFWWYWMRSPESCSGSSVRYVYPALALVLVGASADYGGVRPALNLKYEILVSEINN